MTLTDWQSLSPETAAQLYRRERIRWRRQLAWDTTLTWATVETARVTWGLPGLVCWGPDGRVEGWAFYMVRDGRIDVGGLAASTKEATDALIAGLAERAQGHLGLTGFIYDDAPGLARSLATRAIGTQAYRYLTRPLQTSIPAASQATASWDERHLEETTRLLSEAYGTQGRLFAPNGDPSEWRDYLTQLTTHAGCGVLRPDLSRVVVNGSGIGAVALMTELSPQTAHLAQIAVAPSMRRQGAARSLVLELIGASQRAGYSKMSLLVSTANEAACALYRDLGFVERAAFQNLG